METLNLIQGSDEWLAVRAKRFTASEAPAMLGLSKYMPRQELLRQKASGDTPEVDSFKQRLFDSGHEAEENARPIVESILGEPLYPTTGTLDVEGLPLLASFDGITMDEALCWECKLWNATLAADIEAGVIDDHYWPQLEQQLLVSGAEKVYFTASDGTIENTIGMWYQSVPKRRQQIIAGWKQFAEDLANYKHVEVIPAATATPTLDLPVVSIQTGGSITIRSNLTIFGEALQGFIERLPTKPSTDQEFADCKAALTKLKDAEDKLESEECRALSQMSEIDEMRRQKTFLQELARTTRLALEKLVTQRETAIKAELVQEGKDKLSEHIAALNKRLGRVQMPAIAADFAVAIKGKRTVSSLKNAVDTTLANAKIAANETADKISANLATLDEHKEHAFLFHDIASLAMKANDDLQNVIKLRISEHKAEQQKKLDEEREKIRKEEQERAEREAKEKIAAAATVAEVAAEVIPSPVLQPVLAAAAPAEVAAAPVRTIGTWPFPKPEDHPARVEQQDTAWKIAGRVSEMEEIERVRVLQFCERVLEQREQVAA